MILAQPVAEEVALSSDEFERAMKRAEADAIAQLICGPALTPFLLRKLAEITEGKSLRANCELIVANARLAGEVAVELAR